MSYPFLNLAKFLATAISGGNEFHRLMICHVKEYNQGKEHTAGIYPTPSFPSAQLPVGAVYVIWT